VKIALAESEHHSSLHIGQGVSEALIELGHTIVAPPMPADCLVAIHGRKLKESTINDYPYSIVWLLDEPQEVDVSREYGRRFDLVFSNDRNTVPIHGAERCFYLPLAADPVKCKRLPMVERDDVSFVATCHKSRVELVNQAYALTPEVRWRMVGQPTPYTEGVRFGNRWNQAQIPFVEYAMICCASNIVLDIPRDPFVNNENKKKIPASSISPRLFEAAAMGCFVLTSDVREDAERIFGETLGYYNHDDPKSLVEKIRHYLENKAERVEKAAAAQAIVMKEHLYRHRMATIVEQLEAHHVHV